MKTKTISIFNKCKYFLVIFTITVAFLPRFTFAATVTKRHTVTVTVNTVTLITVTGAITLAIPTGPTAVVTAGDDQMTVTDATTVLKWGTNVATMKITAATSISPKYTLQVVAQNISVVSGTAGTALTQFTVSTTAQTLITGVGLSSGQCNVLYTGIALASQGMGSDFHTITFTITSGS